MSSNLLLALLYGLCSIYLLLVTNRAIDTARTACEEDKSKKLAGESFKNVTGTLIAKSIFLFGILSFGVIMAKYNLHGLLESFMFSLVTAFVFGGASGGILGFLIGCAAWVGGKHQQDLTKTIAITIQFILHALLGFFVFL